MTRMGPYELGARVAEGSTGVVHQARHVELGTTVALKVVRAELRADPGVVSRFRREAVTLAGLDHPGIVRILTVSDDNDADDVWLALEWVDGAELAEVLSTRGPLSPQQAVGVVREALQGLDFAHQRGVVHGDVATGNVLLSVSGRSKLIDFGLACPVGTHGACGTPAFVSPEAASGGQLSPRSDVWSAGAVLYLLLTAEPPLPGPNVEEVLRRHREDPVPRLTGHGPELAGVLATAMAADPAARYADAGAFLHALEDAAERRFGASWLGAASVAGLATGLGWAAVGAGSATSAVSAAAGTAQAVTTASADTGMAGAASAGNTSAAAATPNAAPTPGAGSAAARRARLRVPKSPVAAVAAGVLVVAVVGGTVLATRNSSDSTTVSPPGSLPTNTQPSAPVGPAVVANGAQWSADGYVGRLSCPDGRQVTAAQATVGSGGRTTVVPLVYVGSDVWQAPFPSSGDRDGPSDVEVNGTCGDAPPPPQPDALHMANLEFETPSGLTGSNATVQIVARSTDGLEACPFDAPVARMVWVHGYAPESRTVAGFDLAAQPGMQSTDMRPTGHNVFVVDITDKAYVDESSKDVPGKVYTESVFGFCDFTRTPVAGTSPTSPPSEAAELGT